MEPNFLPADDNLVQWAGRTVPGKDVGSVQFDWLGVSARFSVSNATWVTAVITTEGPARRLKAYTSDQGYGFYPLVQFWVAHASPSNETLLFSIDNKSQGSRTITLVSLANTFNVTTVHGFRSDGIFVSDLHPLPSNRNIEFIGDSITAATNLVRPPNAPACADHNSFQSDWSRSYASLLCHQFEASCSTIAVGGKCMMKECGGLQMPDYYHSALISDAPAMTYNFSNGWIPQVVFIDLGTNDEREIHGLKHKHPNGSALFINETVAFLHSVNQRYSTGNIAFFLAAGPIRNFTARSSRAVPMAVDRAVSQGIDATFVDLTQACPRARQHGNANLCDGCSAHPGIQGHYEMAQLAAPVIARKMGW